MPYHWPRYDPTLKALLHPELSHLHGLHEVGDGWPEEAICAEFARLAYFPFTAEGKARLAKALKDGGFGPPECWDSKVPLVGSWWTRAKQWFRNRDAQAFGATSLDGSITIVAFRGTQPNSLKDLLVDLDFPSVPWQPDSGKVHEGFLKAYRSLAEPIDTWLEPRGSSRLIVTGHSLGAAMATVMAAFVPRAGLVTFGSPLVGDQDFVRAFEGRLVARYVDCSDEVTTVPFEWLGYAHLPELRYIDRNGVVHASPPEAVMEQDRDEAKRDYFRTYLGLGNAPFRNLADHAPVNYVSAVSGARSSTQAGGAADN